MIVRTYHRRQRSGRSSSSLSDQGNAGGGSQGSFWSSSQESLTSAFSALDGTGSDDLLAGLDLTESSQRFKRPAPTGRTDRDKDGRRAPDRKRSKRSHANDGIRQRSSLGIQARVLLQSSQEESQVKAVPAAEEPVRSDVGWGTATQSSLMETKESGELLEHVDEANFAMDGLKSGQPVCVQRASLASILSLCGSLQKRRIMRLQGMCRPLLDAIVALPADDPPIALGAAAVLYLLAIDSHDEDLLDSAPCIQFLMKLLGPGVSPRPERSRGMSSIGAKLLKLSSASSMKKAGTPGSQALDAGGKSVMEKVKELFASVPRSKAVGSRQPDDSGCLHGEEVSSKWLALLTLEKACISTVVLEGKAQCVRSGGVSKLGGSFKERLRELGGLDTVCYIAASCVSNLRASSGDKAKDPTGLDNHDKAGGVGMLLRCFRVMENVTFLSELNRKHLLEFRFRRNDRDEPGSFVQLVLDAVNVLSGKRRLTSNSTKECGPSGSMHDDTSAEQGRKPIALFADCLLSAVKVLMNLTNDNPVGCSQVAACDGIATMAYLIVQHYAMPALLCQAEVGRQSPEHSQQLDPTCSPSTAEEDLVVSVLGVLVNLVEKDDGNRARLANLDIAPLPDEVAKDQGLCGDMDMISVLCSLFLSKMADGEAVLGEMHDEAALQQSQREAEDMIVEAYAALLLAFLSVGSESARSAIAERLPEGLKALVPVLERFLAFHLSLNVLSPETQASVENVIRSCKRPVP